MKNVYLINLSFGLAGIERRFANLWAAINRRGNYVPILVIPAPLAAILQNAKLLPDKPGSVIVIPELKFLTWLGALDLSPGPRLLVTIIRSRFAALGYRKVWRKIRQEPDSIVHIGMNCSALMSPHVPTVYECVDATLSQLGTRHFQRASKRQCIIHCQTNRIQSALDATFAARSPRWKTVTNPTYFAHYEDSGQNVDRNPRLVVFVGRLAPEKNPVLFIESLAKARRERCDCHAVMLGEGPLRPQIESLIKQHGLESYVSIGFHTNPGRFLRGAAVYMSLQTGDNFGSQSLLEAMGAGCAIIASDVGETFRIITDDVGIRVPLTVEAVAEAMVRMVEAPDQTRLMGERAEHSARTTYSSDTYAVFVESLYDEAVHYHGAVRQDGCS